MSAHRPQPSPSGRTVSLYRALLAVLFVLVLGACSTVATRIERDAAWFATLPAEVQANLRRGVVELGYTPRMAHIAFGEPTERRLLSTAEGQSELWLYRYSYPVYDGTEMVGWTEHVIYDSGGRVQRIVHRPHYVEFRHYETRTWLRLRFRDGKLTLIDQPAQ